MSVQIVLATANPHKVEELRAILGATGVEVLSLADLPGGPSRFHEPVEHGSTFEENAAIKALSYARQTGRLCLADDSGLEIDALSAPPPAHAHARPGVISSHYCTGGRETGMTRAQRDQANNARVLRELEGVPAEQRTARFVCCMCLASPPGPEGAPAVPHTCRGTFEGRIGIPPRVPSGSNGFGYDPLFLVAPFFVETSAELTASEKNRLSHRGQAARAMAAWLQDHRGRAALEACARAR